MVCDLVDPYNKKIEKMKSDYIEFCPFCGNAAKYIEHEKMDGNVSYTAGLVCCDNAECGCRTQEVAVDGYYGTSTTKHDVIKIWNRRNQK